MIIFIIDLLTITYCFDLFSFCSCFLDHIDFVKKLERKLINAHLEYSIALNYYLFAVSE